MSQQRIDDEVKKVQTRLVRWARYPQQINARILTAFLTLPGRGKTAITKTDIKEQYRRSLKINEEDTFDSNFQQMINFGERNHAKVFEESADGDVGIWPPAADAVRKFERETAHGSDAAIPLSESFSPNEWRVRRDLAACYRLFVRFGWTDLIFTHLSARVPGQADQYLINPYGLLFDEVTASALLKVDFDGNVIAGDEPYNDAGHAIHTAVLKARPEVGAVLHSHTRAGMAVSCMKCGLLPITQQANEVRALVCRHEYDVATDSEEECRHLGRDLGDKWLMIMHNHGLLSAGRTVAEAFYFLYTLENACKVQVDVLASGAEIIVPDEDALARVEEYARPSREAPGDFVTRSWSALIRLLDRQDPSYKT